MYQATTDAYRIAVTRGADTLRIIEHALPRKRSRTTNGPQPPRGSTASWTKRRVRPARLVTIRQDDLDLDHVEVWRLERVGGE